jgi:hypothetical protein
MFGQDAVEAVRQEMGAQFHNVRQDFLLWDTLRIGANVPTQVSGWFANFTDLLADGNKQSFFNQRQESEAHTAYTNMKKKTGLDWHVIITDIGIGFYYPDPINVDMFDGDRASSKLFNEMCMSDSSCALFIGGADYKILSFVPEMAPYGFGPSGNQVGGSLTGYASLVNNGLPTGGNRFWFTNQAIPLPKDTAINVDWLMEKPLRDLMTAMVAPQPIPFASGDYVNEVKVRVCIRGLREVQQLGNMTR